jgi:hypothetical protein
LVRILSRIPGFLRASFLPVRSDSFQYLCYFGDVMRWGRFTGEGNVRSARAALLRQPCLAQLAAFFIAVALTVMTPAPASSQSIVDIVAPGAKDYPTDFKFPSPKCEDDCRKFLALLNAIRKDLAKFDTPEWRDWAEKDQKVRDAEAALKPFADAQSAAKEGLAAAKGKGAAAVATAKSAVTSADNAAKDPAAAKKKADDDLKKADAKLPKGNKTSDIEELRRLAKEAPEAVAKLKACLEKCKEKAGDDGEKGGGGGVIDGPVKGGGVKPIKLPAIPDCTQPNFEAKKEAFLTELGRLAAGISKVLGGQEGGGERKAAKLGEMDKSDPGYDELKKEVEELRAQLRSISDLQEKAEAEWAKKCPPKQGSMYIPGTPGRNGQQYATMIPGSRTPGENVSYSVPFATDSTTYCTFGEGTGVPGYTTATDDNGVDFPPSSYGGSTDGTPGGPGPKTVSIGNPKTPPASTPGDGVPPGTAATPKPVDTPTATTTDGPKTASTPTPKPSDTPVATTTENPKTVSTPTPTPTDTPVATTDKPNTPTTTDTPTPQTTTDDTPPVHITIYIKASEAVLDGSQTGEPIQGQIVKLVMREKPAVPTTAENKTDTGYDRPAPQCTTGASGECKVDVPPEDRPLYAMNQTPRIGGKPVSHFRLAINLMQHTGGIAETTGKKVPDLKDSMSSGNFTAELVKIGERTFVRLGFNTPYGATGDLVKKFSELLGVPVEIDICLVKEPGPPLGSEPPASYQAINQELPHAAIKLRPTQTRASIR